MIIFVGAMSDSCDVIVAIAVVTQQVICYVRIAVNWRNRIDRSPQEASLHIPRLSNIVKMEIKKPIFHATENCGDGHGNRRLNG